MLMDSSNVSFPSLPFVEFSNNLVPAKFIWPIEENPLANQDDEDLNEPIVDLEGFFKGENESTQRITELVRSACSSHGLFQVINHGVDLNLISSVHDNIKMFFKLPIEEKMRVHKVPESFWGYSLAHADRFSYNLPWKETVSACFFHEKGINDSEAALFFKSAFGQHQFEQIGLDFKNYCEAMKGLSLTIMEILGMSLGVDGSYFKKILQDGNSIMRCNFYPPCPEPGQALGTGPHCDPPALTILYQDQVGGLEVFSDHKWKSVRPRRDALVVNIGDTFSALSNGAYKSCKHRAVVNKSKERVSLAHFLCPKQDKLIVPPLNLQRPIRKFPDYKWSDFLKFRGQTEYRVDLATLQNFTKWLTSTNPNPS